MCWSWSARTCGTCAGRPTIPRCSPSWKRPRCASSGTWTLSNPSLVRGTSAPSKYDYFLIPCSGYLCSFRVTLFSVLYLIIEFNWCMKTPETIINIFINLANGLKRNLLRTTYTNSYKLFNKLPPHCRPATHSLLVHSGPTNCPLPPH